MKEASEFELPSRGSGLIDRGYRSRSTFGIFSAILLLTLAAAAWFLLRPDTLPEEVARGEVIESIDEALEILAEPDPDGQSFEAERERVLNSLRQPREKPNITLDDLPELDRSDERLFEALKGGEEVPAWLSWLQYDELIRKLVTIVDRAGDGEIAANFMSLPSVDTSFEVSGPRDNFIVQSSNYARYTPYVRVINMIDGQALVDVYRQFEPLFESAYAELGYPDRSFAQALDRALAQALVRPPSVANGQMKRIGDRYQYVNETLEGLPGVQKLYLRIGPAHTSVIQNKAAEIRDALR